MIKYCKQGSSRVPAPPWVGSRSPDGWDQIPYRAGGWILHQPPWSFGFDSQTRGSARSAGQRNQPSTRASCVPVCVCWRCLPPLRAPLAPILRQVLRTAQPAQSCTVLARPVWLFVCVIAASFCSLVRDEQTHPHRPRLVVSRNSDEFQIGEIQGRPSNKLRRGRHSSP